MLVLLLLASVHNCNNSIFQTIKNQEQAYQIMENSLLFLIWWSCLVVRKLSCLCWNKIQERFMIITYISLIIKKQLCHIKMRVIVFT